jgi:hypothetical protein
VAARPSGRAKEAPKACLNRHCQPSQSFEGATFPVAPFSCPPSPGQRTLGPFIEWLIAGAIVWRELPCLQRSI